MDLYHYKEKLQLESWHNNKYLSEEMKQFFKDIIQNSQDSDLLTNNRIHTLENDIRLMELFLNHKGTLNQYNKFKSYLLHVPYPTEVMLKNFFRKEKINRLLNNN